MHIEATWQDMKFHTRLESGEEVAFPMAYWARIDDPETPYLIELNVQVHPPGDPYCQTFEALQRPGGEAVTPEGLRRIRFTELLAASLGAVMHKIEHAEDGSSRIIPPKEHGEFRSIKRRRRRVLTDDFLRKVAETYRDAYRDGNPPVREVAKKLSGSRSSAARWVQEARSRGLLGPTDQRKAGI